MLKTILLSAIVVGVCLLGMCFNIIFKKDGKFPDSEISHNKELRKRGIICAKEEELRIWGKKNGKANASCADIGCHDCSGCK
jgi:hypothetical protein